MSTFFSLNVKDIIKGVVVAVLGAVMSALLTILNSGALPTMADLKTIGITGVTAGIAYLVKNFFTNSNDQILKTENAGKP